MPAFLVVVDPGFDRELRRIQRAGDSDAVDRVLAALRRLVEDPVTSRPGFEATRLGLFRRHEYRLTVGEYRVLYEVDLEERTAYVSTVYRAGRRGRRP